VASWASWIEGINMAQYEFMCQVCLNVTVLQRKIADELPRDPYCENCMIPMARIWTAIPAHFKGKGWGSDK